MDFSKENQLSFADTDANHLFRDHLHQAAYRYAHYRASQTQKPLNEKFILLSNSSTIGKSSLPVSPTQSRKNIKLLENEITHRSVGSPTNQTKCYG